MKNRNPARQSPAGQRRRARRKRQLGGASAGQVDLNVSVPYIFRPRLYPYGEANGDKILGLNSNTQAYVLINELVFLEENFTVIYVNKNGVVGFSPGLERLNKDAFSKSSKTIAVFWTENSIGDTGRVYFRESDDENILQLASSEIQIQYRYSSEFRPRSVFIITWENVAPPHASADLPNGLRNVFQLAIIISKNGTFAHVVYSKLKWHDNAVAGFNQGPGGLLNLPGSGTPNVLHLANTSDMGIPGEWLFKIDGRSIYMCASGVKGTDCSGKCEKGEFYYDCARSCHCGGNGYCDLVSGYCFSGQCITGWSGLPTCELDVDECQLSETLCPDNQPDCINTPGSYKCTCLMGFNNFTQTCYGKSSGVSNFDTSIDFPGVLNPNLQLVNNAPVSKNGQNNNKNLLHFGPVLFPDLSLPPVDEGVFESRSTDRTVNVLAPVAIFEKHQSLTEPNLTVSHPQQLAQHKILFVPFCNGSCGANAHCELIQEIQKCACNTGWTGDGYFCVDINECLLDNACEKETLCDNTLGSYACLCDKGLRSDGRRCVDIDECAEGIAQCPLANVSACANTFGSYECKCRTGYNGSPNSSVGCIDINECLISEFYCGTYADCENTIGAYRCHCHQGYERNADGTVCEDVDECKNSPCSSAAGCQNTVGSFLCHCIEGFVGDGFSCEETKLYSFNRTDNVGLLKLPNQSNFVAELPLKLPMHIFGNVVNKIYVSSNGIVTFDNPSKKYTQVSSVIELKYTGVAVLYQNNDLTNPNSLVYAKETSDYGILTRVNLNVRESYHDRRFQAKSAVIVTYENVTTTNQTDMNTNTVQMILASDDRNAYIIIIYDRVVNENAQAVILNVRGADAIVLPFSGINASTLAESSNVNVPGRWMFKIEDKKIFRCPFGLSDPPYCTSDIDECALGTHLCFKMAACSNTIGSYKCICQPGWTGDGFSCFELTTCFMTSGAVCGEHASCTIPANRSNPICLCDVGYFGDGRVCLLITDSKNTSFNRLYSKSADTSNFTTGIPQPLVFESINRLDTKNGNFDSTKSPARSLNLNTKFNQFGSTNFSTDSTRFVDQKQKDVKNKDLKLHEPSANSGKDNAKSKRLKPKTDSSSYSNFLMIMICSIPIIVWIFVITIVIIICARKRKQKENGNNFYGYYVPSSRDSKDSVLTGYYGSQNSAISPGTHFDHFYNYYANSSENNRYKCDYMR